MDAHVGQTQRASFVTARVRALKWTAVGAVGAVGLVFVATGLPASLRWFGVDPELIDTTGWLRWPVLLLLLAASLSVAYRFAAAEVHTSWKAALLGGFAAALLWLVAAIGLSLYVTSFGRYDETYGALAGAIVTMLWFQLSAYAVLAGAELTGAIDERDEQRTPPPRTTDADPRPRPSAG